MIPSVGRIVHITLSEACADNINRRRGIYTEVAKRDKSVATSIFHGNPVSGGQVYPMIITRVWSDNPTEATAVQGQIFLDGDDCYWATSVSQGTEKGQWFEPPRI